MLDIRPAGVLPASPGATRADAHRAAAGFEALLVAQALKPLAEPMGFFGEIAIGAMARAIAERDDGGLTRRLESQIETAQT